MAVKKVKVTALHGDLYYDGVPYQRGNILEIPEHMLNEWLALGHITAYVEPAVVPEAVTSADALDVKMEAPAENKMVEPPPNKGYRRGRRPTQFSIIGDESPTEEPDEV
jgi:hypothetical protein